MKIGSVSINVLSDGTLMTDGGALFGPVPKQQWEQFLKPDRRNRVKIAVNSLLIQSGNQNILVDSGIGVKNTAKYKDLYSLNGNKLIKSLKSHGLTARDIDIVILTSLQYMQAGGCTKLDRSGSVVPTFQKAKHIVQASNWEIANNPDERGVGLFNQDDFVPLMENGQIELVEGDQEVISGINVKVTDGPVVGHQIVMIDAGSERIGYLGNLIPTPHHLPLAAISAIDQHPQNSLDFKRQTIQNAIESGWLLVFGNALEAQAGYIGERNGRNSFTPREL